jgi:hypothetical protein
MPELLRIEHREKHFGGIRALHDVSFSIEAARALTKVINRTILKTAARPRPEKAGLTVNFDIPLGSLPVAHIQPEAIARALRACGTCGFLRPLTAKPPDFWAPLGVCKVENAQNCAFSLSFGLKPHRLLSMNTRFRLHCLEDAGAYNITGCSLERSTDELSDGDRSGYFQP